MPMLMMSCSSFSDSNTRVLHPSPIKESRPEIKVLGQVVEKEMLHIFISLFLVQGRGWCGSIPFLQTIVHISQIT
jgi:hypothetical protein